MIYGLENALIKFHSIELSKYSLSEGALQRKALRKAKLLPVLPVVVPQNGVMRAPAPDAALLMIIDLLFALRAENSLQLQDLCQPLAGQAQLYVIGLFLALQDQKEIRIGASIR
jgi:hypothetical protein